MYIYIERDFMKELVHVMMESGKFTPQTGDSKKSSSCSSNPKADCQQNPCTKKEKASTVAPEVWALTAREVH
jgi:hypothetical protein